MTYLIDTHALVFWLTRRTLLGKNAARIFRRAERGEDSLYVSALSLFEIVMLVERGRFRLPMPWPQWMQTLEATSHVSVEPIGVEDISTARNLKPLVDPFDRLIVGTAQRLGVPFITRDERICASGLVTTIW